MDIINGIALYMDIEPIVFMVAGGGGLILLIAAIALIAAVAKDASARGNHPDKVRNYGGGGGMKKRKLSTARKEYGKVKPPKKETRAVLPPAPTNMIDPEIGADIAKFDDEVQTEDLQMKIERLEQTVRTLETELAYTKESCSDLGASVMQLSDESRRSREDYVSLLQRVIALESGNVSAAQTAAHTPAQGVSDSAYGRADSAQGVSDSAQGGADDEFDAVDFFATSERGAPAPPPPPAPAPAGETAFDLDSAMELSEFALISASDGVAIPKAATAAKSASSKTAGKSAKSAKAAKSASSKAVISALSDELDPVTEIYNKWAANPTDLNIPELSYFDMMSDAVLNTPLFFASGDVRAEWIVGEIGEERYLYPNPASLRNLDAYKALYDVSGDVSGGKNGVRVLLPCKLDSWDQVSDRGRFEIV
ncbi:hypothetical protein FACS1894133_7230 [Clostridia bacterium]|nr:hypothetical protein FACS1894133_7230 [Clostridia bacterium]